MFILTRCVLLIGSLLFFLIGVGFQNPKVLLIATLIIFSHNIIYSLNKFFEKIIFFCFNVTFFIFLIGRMIVTEFFGYKSNLLGVFGLAFSDLEIVNVVIICLYLSLLAIYIGYVLIQKIDLSFLKQKKELNPGYVNALRLFSLMFFFFSMVFRLIYVYQMQQAAVTEGYFESFANFRSSLPGVLETISRMYDVAFFAYLATMPSKKRSFFPVMLYIVEGFLSALAGRRSIFMLNLLIVFIYYCVRSITTKKKDPTNQVIKKERKWFGKFEWILGIVALPVLLTFMTVIGKLRSSNWQSTEKISFLDSIYEFFYTQGISVNLIGYTQLYGNSLPEGKWYTFGPLFEFVDNRIIRPIAGMPELFGQTVERAIDGYLYAHALSYVIMPDLYLKGVGYGSSYLAELFKDFSFTGVFVGSIVYGALIYVLFYMLKNSNYILIIFTLMMIRSLLFAPRGAYLSFIVSSFSMPKILAVIFIIIGAKLLYSLIGNRKMKFKRITWN
ncbi:MULTISPECIES: O-antigen polysaccharide polymerase Wzy family protein [unclassified Bacillus (in: firmicutes)]|uniref:O-antigen polysaccharide polymerase Wzy family protein n=1 Tax=unclassified Bacillus (in: firmicutes) TaxID=185979 RepID=UPI001BEA89E1|nr:MULTISPECIES: O-antigen polysaccharide polymerase Wzy family protein [unclassified Bacillus (in: firmicutes)]MBT2615338.1 O-antigen polysaccharide polymerase Wzy family protein [Bacillus sp. ISL-78]MBT2628048.1 O-antigen polysaccharide polymerase Wzy family protein [Bacillus sp. ISL-101]